MSEKGMIAMSGGVDSSVAALLTLQGGADCVGVTLKLFENADVGESREKTCCSLADAEDARRVAYAIGIPHYVFDFSEDFRRDVLDRFAREYLEGRTPNPCIDCNRFIKFKRLTRRAADMGFDFVATGHYARISRDAGSGRMLLLRAADASKDQSYVLYAMTQEELARTRFPLGALRKREVREIAAENDFVNARKRDSQDICFVRDGKYADFIEQYTGAACPPGDFTDGAGTVIGRHRGHIRYTIGQRRGLGLALRTPLYVREKRAGDNTVVLSPEKDLYSRVLEARNINLIAAERLDRPLRVTAKLRYAQEASAATVWQTDGDALRVEFDAPQRAVAAGQAVVLYDGDIVIGGGDIITGGK
ncbi:MAG: tRNA 2-thiouridine(34) synthase MnmA [Clostridiales Family XIII bacterium]|jgi:tRNA-specific 2-thiouridylase|nr:tRNA 2-thiouridine(34) synthase MnmA [Clostridiales Family XIII bacterium]